MSDSSAAGQPLSAASISALLAEPLNSPAVIAWLTSLHPISPTPSTTPPAPTVKSFPEAQYHTYLPLGLDLIYSPTSSPAAWELDRIDIYNPVPGVAPPVAGTSRRRAPPVYTPPKLPLVIQLARAPVNPPQPPSTSDFGAAGPATPQLATEILPPASVDGDIAPEPFLVTAEATGREFVAALGEPSRKGGAQGWVGPWLEWSDLRVLVDLPGGEEGGREVGVGLMVELRPTHREPTEDEKKKGLGGVWDQAASWSWGCVKIFRLGSTI